MSILLAASLAVVGISFAGVALGVAMNPDLSAAAVEWGKRAAVDAVAFTIAWGVRFAAWVFVHARPSLPRRPGTHTTAIAHATPETVRELLDGDPVYRKHIQAAHMAGGAR